MFLRSIVLTFVVGLFLLATGPSCNRARCAQPAISCCILGLGSAGAPDLVAPAPVWLAHGVKPGAGSSPFGSEPW